MENSVQQRRSLKYIRFAAFLAGQPAGIDEIVMLIPEIEDVVGETLPPNARFPSWWRNDSRRMHSRAWMSAGWEVAEMIGRENRVVFRRSSTDS